MGSAQKTMPRVVIVGAGFGGLNAAQKLAGKPVQVTVIDRKNHHTFQPLLYQVALAVLSPAEIASPVRAIFRNAGNISVLLGEVDGVDLQHRKIKLRDASLELEFDYLVLATGATHAYFGHKEWEKWAPGLKTIEDALEIRRRVLLSFELAERELLETGKHEPLNFVIIGAGPTGVELAGAISDIAYRYMRHDFRGIDPTKARILLLEGGPRVLAAYPPDLSASAERQLRELGVEVRTNALVTSVEADQVRVGEEIIPASVILWAAGVQASPLGRQLGVETDQAGRVKVEPDLSIRGNPNVFVIGDLATASDDEGKPLPGVAPAAIQMGKFVAATVLRDLKGEPRRKFVYLDKGSLATIGRSKAVGMVRKLHFSGRPAWLAWLLVHVFFLIGFRNRFFVLLEWAWSYFSFQRNARLITGDLADLEKKPEVVGNQARPAD